MKLREAIEKVNRLKENEYGESQIAEWVTELENYMIDNVFNKAEGFDYEKKEYEYEESAEEELLVPDPYSELYVHYIASKIDYWNREMDSYNNSVAMYNAAYQNFANHMRRMYKPKSSVNRKIWLH